MSRLLTTKEVQSYLRLSRTSTYKLISKKDFPKIKIGNSIRVDEESFYKWISDNLGHSIEL